MGMTDLRDRLASLTPEQQRMLAARLAKDKTPRIPPIKPQSRKLAGSVMSFAQQRLWLLHQLEPGMNHYHIPLAFEFIGELDILALKRAWIEVIRRHESLRTRFLALENAPTQIIDPIDVVQPMKVIDLFADDRVEDKYREACRIIDEEAAMPFDLGHGHPCKGLLIKAGKQENYLLFAFHHIVFDGWSLGVFQRELLTLYSCYSQGKPSPLAELPFQYADYAIWQRKWLTEEELDKQLQYWLGTLNQAPSALELPTDRPRSATQTFRGDVAQLCLPEAVVQLLLQLSRREGSTLFMTLLAAFQALLYRYSGQHDFCIGTPIANRRMSEIEGMIGFFVNTLVIRSNLSNNSTFRELMQQTKKQVLGAYEHQDLPFDQLVQALQPDRETSHSPLFQVMFAMNDDSFQHMVQSDGLQVKLFPIVNKTSKYDLSLTMSHVRNHGIIAELEYNTDLFDSQTMERMLEHFHHLLNSIVFNPDLSVSSLEIMGDCERQLLLSEWNRTEAAYPSNMCIHEIVEKQASLFPSAIAVTSGSEHLTYQEVNIRANRMARHLQRLGIGTEVLVGLLADRSVEQIIGLLAILKSGGAYVPIDPAYPDERITYMIEDAQIHVLLAQKRHAERVQHANLTVLPLEGIGAISQDGDESAPDSGSAPGHLAYVVYTSGSTGRPKGVEIEHHSLLNLVSWHQNAYRISSIDRATWLAGPAFDASVWEIWPYLASGASIHIPDEDTRLDPYRLRDWLVDERITVSFLPTPLAEAVLSLNWPDVCSLRCMLTGGDKLRYFPPETLPFRLFNHYGPSEGTVVATTCHVPVKSRSSAELTAPTIGRPIANMRIYLLDRQRHPVPVGIVGEIYIAGHGLARGYLRRPELTAERFGYTPSLPGERLYRTGDLARYLPDGSIEFMGRADDQVKIRGYRIEPGEIETALTLHPAIEQAIVSVKEPGPGDKRLVAYIIQSADAAHERLDISELRLHMQARLPKYMVPAAFVVMEALPMTPNGKVDRNALPASNFTDKEEEYVPPRTATEKKLADIWSQVLGIESISIHDNYFNLGGDSILSTQIAGKVRQLGLEMKPKYLFQYQSIAELAPVLEALKPSEPHEFGQREVTGSLPLTPIQRWLFEEVSVPEHFNQSMILSVNSQISYEVLERALAHVVAHHDALRLRFAIGQSGWEQSYAACTDESPLKRIDLRDQSAPLQADAYAAALTEAQRGFDLSEGMLLRAIYFDYGVEQAGKLALVIHHLAIDGVSWRILLDDLGTACQQLVASEALNLPSKTASYREWAHSLAAYATTDQLRAEQEYWLHQVNTPPPLIPLDCPDGANTVASLAVSVSNLSSEQTRILLQEAPAAFGAQIDAILLAALGRAVSGWSGERRLFIHMEGHGREELFTDLDISRTVGWFTNMYPVMLEVKESADIHADIQVVKERLHRIPQRGIGYGLLRYMTEDDGIANQLRKLPRPMMSFNYLGQFNAEWSKGEKALFTLVADTAGQDLAPDSERAHYVDVAAMVTSGRLHISLSYSENVHRKQTIENLARRFEGELRMLIGLCQHSKCQTSVNERKMNDVSALDASSKWFVRKKVNPQAAIRLFCLPYVGGNASIFRGWDDHLPAFAEVCAVQYPGRGARLRESAYTSMTPLLEAVSHAMMPLLDKPYILFGYSMGALLAYELSILLSRSLNRPPLKLIVAGLNAPFVQSPVSPIHDLPEEEFRNQLRLNGGIPEELIDDEELLELMSPSLRADFSVCETYEYTQGTVPCPIVALGGQDDEFLSEQSLTSWRSLTNADFSSKLLPGGHFFLLSHPEQLLSAIRKEIECINTGTIYASKT